VVNIVLPTLVINKFAFCIYGFIMFLSVNIDYFLKQHLPIDPCNGEVLCVGVCVWVCVCVCGCVCGGVCVFVGRCGV
jgi:hypothetical protein